MVAVVGLLAVRPAAAQVPPVEVFRGAVASYVNTGDAASAVERLVGWDQATLDTVVSDIVAKSNPVNQQDADFLEAAALLHLEIAVAVGGLSTASALGYLEFGERFLTSLIPKVAEAARSLGVPRRANIARFQWTWYAVAGSVFLSVNDPVHAQRLLRKADAISPKNPVVLTLQGIGEEINGGGVNPDDWDQLAARTRLGRARASILFRAERLYREALKLDPNYPLAQIRLGRVLHLNKLVKDAGPWLQKGNASAVEPSHKYIGAMFLGAWRQDNKDLNGAREAYETALSIAPRSQNAIVALAYLELIAGRAHRAQDLARGYLQTPNSDEAWWASKSGALDLVGLQWLRKQVRR